jgi:tight adherence protein C
MLLPIAAGLTLFLALSFVLLATMLKPSVEAERLMRVVATGRPEARIIGQRERLENGIRNIAAKLRSMLGVRTNERIRERLTAAGFRNASAADIFSAMQWLIPLVGAVSATFLHDNELFWAFMFAIAGYLLPGIWLAFRIKARKETLRRSLPDMMDLLVICVDAGLGMDQAMMRVVDELAVSHVEIQQELYRIQLEQRAGSPRLEAWKRFAARVEIDEVNAFVSMLSQTDRFGTPIARALGRFAEDLRGKRRQRAEEAAAKTKVKIVFPLVFFIFPCLFIVLLAPAIMGIMNAFQDFK